MPYHRRMVTLVRLLVPLVLATGCRVGFDPLTSPDAGEPTSTLGGCAPGTACQADAPPGSAFYVACVPGLPCLVDCELAATCVVDCNGASSCAVSCPASDCAVLDCGPTCSASCAGAPPIQVEGDAICP